MPKRNVWKTCLMALLLMSWATVATFAESSTKECAECEKKDALLNEAEIVIVELLDENTELLIELEDSWTSCEIIVKATATEAVAAAVKPLLIEVAGLEVSRDYWRGRVLPWTIGGVLGGLVVGIVLTLVLL